MANRIRQKSFGTAIRPASRRPIAPNDVRREYNDEVYKYCYQYAGFTIIAFRDMIVVNVPDPRDQREAIGTTVADDESFSLLKNSSPKTISNPR